MRYRFNLQTMLLFIDVDEKQRKIHRIELEGELPLLIADRRHGSATLWMLSEDMVGEYGFDAHDYSREDEDGETHIWKWYDAEGNVMLRVVIFNPKDCADEAGQVVVAVGEGGETTRSLFNFMTDFKGWNFLETYGDAEASLVEYGFQLIERKE